MKVRITKLRLALAASVCVLGGVGIATLLSPLVGSALATAGQIVNIADRTSPYTARVDVTGALKTAGLDAPTLPRLPFNSSIGVAAGGSSFARVLGPTPATVALTDLKIANYFGNTGGRAVYFYQYSAPSPNTSCSASHSRYLGYYDVPARDSLHANFETPLVLKPLLGGDAWCLMVAARAPAGATTTS